MNQIVIVGQERSKFRIISLIFIIALVLISAVSGLFSLRHNNLRMQELRIKVSQADRAYFDNDSPENLAKLETALRNLRGYVTNHMNSNLNLGDDEISYKPIQLIYKYNRDTVALWRAQIRSVGADEQILNAALNQCKSDNIPPEEFLHCLADKTKNESGFPPVESGGILSPDFYAYNYASPKWSPDFAGWSLALLGFGVVALIVRAAI